MVILISSTLMSSTATISRNAKGDYPGGLSKPGSLGNAPERDRIS
jgi:hypothetical protein